MQIIKNAKIEGPHVTIDGAIVDSEFLASVDAAILMPSYRLAQATAHLIDYARLNDDKPCRLMIQAHGSEYAVYAIPA